MVSLGHKATLQPWTATTLFTLPEGFRPSRAYQSIVSDGSSPILMIVNQDGTVQLNPFNVAVSDKRMYGSCAFPAA